MEATKRHSWLRQKPSPGLRQCAKCGKVSTIKSHSTLGGCKPVKQESMDEESNQDLWTEKIAGVVSKAHGETTPCRVCYQIAEEIRALTGNKDCWNCHIAIDEVIESVRKKEKLDTLRELRDLWFYEQAGGSAVMAIRLDKWIEYCRKAGITDDWWELREE